MAAKGSGVFRLPLLELAEPKEGWRSVCISQVLCQFYSHFQVAQRQIKTSFLITPFLAFINRCLEHQSKKAFVKPLKLAQELTSQTVWQPVPTTVRDYCLPVNALKENGTSLWQTIFSKNSVKKLLFVGGWHITVGAMASKGSERTDLSDRWWAKPVIINSLFKEVIKIALQFTQ